MLTETARTFRDAIETLRKTLGAVPAEMADIPWRADLYLAAATHLCGLWVKKRPEANLKNDLLKGRTLP